MCPMRLSKWFLVGDVGSAVNFFFFFLMIRRPPRSTPFPTRRSSDLSPRILNANFISRPPRQQLNFYHTPSILQARDRKSTRLNSSHLVISYAVFCLKKKKTTNNSYPFLRPNAPTTEVHATVAAPRAH